MLMNATYTVRSNFKRPVNVTVVVRFAEREAIYTADHAEGAWYSVTFPATELGSHLLSVYSDGDQLPNSPFLFAVTLQTCRDSPGRVAGVDGRCVCPSDAVEVLGRCVKYTTLLPAVILPVAAVSCAVVLGYVLWLRGLDSEVVNFLIDPCEVVYSKPEEVIGLGPESKVVRAEFRGAPVAIKIYLNVKSEVSAVRKMSRAGSIEGRRTSSHGNSVQSGSSFSSNDGVSPKSRGDLAFSGTSSGAATSVVSVNNRWLSEGSGCEIEGTQSSSQQPGPRKTSINHLRGMGEAQKAAQAMATTRHPNILTVMGALIHREGRSKAELRLMMELMELGR